MSTSFFMCNLPFPLYFSYLSYSSTENLIWDGTVLQTGCIATLLLFEEHDSAFQQEIAPNLIL